MKECDNSTRKVTRKVTRRIHINSNFIFFIVLLIMFDTLFVEVVEQYAHSTPSHTSHCMYKTV
jgi:hypothetical protein